VEYLQSLKNVEKIKNEVVGEKFEVELLVLSIYLNT